MDKISIIVILGALVLMVVFMNMRQKRDAKRSQELMNSFKVGDKVLTHIGIYGKIKRIYNTTNGKVCVLEIGTLDKIDIELDMRYIAAIDEKTAVAEEPKEEEKKVEHTEDKQMEDVEQKEKTTTKQPNNKSKNNKKRK